MFLALLLSCEESGEGGPQLVVDDYDSGLEVDEDVLAPVIEHDPVFGPQSASGYVNLSATITDDSDVVGVTLFFRRQVSLDWEQRSMQPQGQDIYVVSLTPDDLSSAGIHYYIEAIDQYGNTGEDPRGAPSDYHKFDLTD